MHMHCIFCFMYGIRTTSIVEMALSTEGSFHLPVCKQLLGTLMTREQTTCQKAATRRTKRIGHRKNFSYRFMQLFVFGSYA